MNDVVIKAENLGKKYVIGHQAERGGYTALRDVLMQNARTLWNKTKDLATGKPIIQGDTLEEVWALKDVSFEIRRGEAVGIIGRNGAGKSTLLKILSRITEPSTGRVTIKGRVASLLEVGTGFHPELSGRENIYLNGTILGMTRVEIKQKFDEIVAFAEVEKYLDTPVKRYSSGMYVRLAFAVAAHLEPEILVVDEVLAVGDAQFQKKCLGKMGDVAKEGRTVLFVSHNMGAIASLCRNCMLLENGQLSIMSGNVPKIVQLYLASGLVTNQNANVKIATEYFEVKEMSLYRSGIHSTSFTKADTIDIDIKIDVFQTNSSLTIGYALYEKTTEQCLWWSFCVDVDSLVLKAGSNQLKTSIPRELLNDGDYRIELLAGIHNQKWILEPGKGEVAIEFSVKGGTVGSIALSSTQRPTFLFPALSWELHND